MPELSPRENTAGYEVDPVLRQWICMNVCYGVILVIYLLVKPAGPACIIEPICLLLLNQNISILCYFTGKLINIIDDDLVFLLTK